MLIIFVVEDFDESLADEIHFLDITFVTDYGLAWCVDAAIHVYDQFVGESTLTFLEKVVKTSFKFFEHPSILDQIRLHFGGDLLVELEFLDD